MTEDEFRKKDNRENLRRRLEILRGNHELFERRAHDPNYGTQQDRIIATGQADDARLEIESIERELG